MRFYELHEVVRVQQPESYSNEGIIALVDGDRAGIFRFGHCSCSDTYLYEWAEPHYEKTEHYIDKVDWTGTLAELKEIADNRLDWNIKGRTISEEDYDYYLVEKFLSILSQWFVDRQTVSVDVPHQY